MQINPENLAEIYQNLEHGEITSIANQLGLSRNKVRSELTDISKADYDQNIIHAAIKRIEARGIILNTLLK